MIYSRKIRLIFGSAILISTLGIYKTSFANSISPSPLTVSTTILCDPGNNPTPSTCQSAQAFLPNATPVIPSLMDLGTTTYYPSYTYNSINYSFMGGLYAGGTNTVPSTHYSDGLKLAQSIQPLDVNGNPPSNPAFQSPGKVVMLSVGMSNTTMDFCTSANKYSGLTGGGLSSIDANAVPISTWGGWYCDADSFMGQAWQSASTLNPNLFIINGALNGRAAQNWKTVTQKGSVSTSSINCSTTTSASASINDYDRVNACVLTPLKLTEAQVQVVWLKLTDPVFATSTGSTLSLANQASTLADPTLSQAFTVRRELAGVLRALRYRYPNLKMVFITPRMYAGYATATLNPEPYAYENGFSVRWVIESQIYQGQSGILQGNGNYGPPTGTYYDGIGDISDMGDLHYDPSCVSKYNSTTSVAQSCAPWVGWGPYLWAHALNTPANNQYFVNTTLFPNLFIPPNGPWAAYDFSGDGTHPNTMNKGTVTNPGAAQGQYKVGSALLNFFSTQGLTSCWFKASGSCY